MNKEINVLIHYSFIQLSSQRQIQMTMAWLIAIVSRKSQTFVIPIAS